MVEGRIQRPVIDETKCDTCGVCLHQCPAEFLVEYRSETDSIRGAIYRKGRSLTSFEDEEDAFPPCQKACPIGQDVLRYVSLLAEGRLKEAYAAVRETNPLPAICGLVCHHPCEDACMRGFLDDPVAIRTLKEFLALYGSEKEAKAPHWRKNRGKKVAVIGAGPAGLAAAHDLAQRGYRPTVFECLPVAGGMLSAGIPPYRLPRNILQAEIDAILSHNTELRTGIALGQDFIIEDLHREGYKAVFIATGAHHSQWLNIEGESLEGVLGGVEFLRRINLGEDIIIGERLAVIGGGNVAIDSARSALRHGAKKVSIFYRRTRKEMPAISEEIGEAQREGIRIHWLTTPKAFLGDNGKLQGIVCVKNRLDQKDASGRRIPVPIPGSDRVVQADNVIVAIGQETGAKELGLGIEISKNGTIPVNPYTAESSVPGIFAGGDVVTGPGWAIDAIAWGKKAAQGIHAYLSGP